jgi:hypothetical protein
MVPNEYSNSKMEGILCSETPKFGEFKELRKGN